MKYLVLLILLASLCTGLTYIGDKKLCCIDSDNVMTCLSVNQTISMDSDLTCELHEQEYTVTKDNLMDIPTIIFRLLTCLVILYIFFLVIKRK